MIADATITEKTIIKLGEKKKQKQKQKNKTKQKKTLTKAPLYVRPSRRRPDRY